MASASSSAALDVSDTPNQGRLLSDLALQGGGAHGAFTLSTCPDRRTAWHTSKRGVEYILEACRLYRCAELEYGIFEGHLWYPVDAQVIQCD